MTMPTPVYIYMIDYDRKVIGFKFGNDINAASRGLKLDEKEFNNIVSNMTIAKFFELKTKGFQPGDDALSNAAEKAYQEYLNAKQNSENSAVLS